MSASFDSEGAAALRIRQWETPAGVAASALFSEEFGYDIYILEFVNGEECVGQTRRFGARFSSHRQRWDDVRRVSFAPCLPEGLNQAERTVIASRITGGLRLRNINLQSEPLATSPLDLVIDRELQERWLCRARVRGLVDHA